MLAPARPVTSPFAHSTERSADVVPIHHSNDGGPARLPAPSAGIGHCAATTTCRPRISVPPAGGAGAARPRRHRRTMRRHPARPRTGASGRRHRLDGAAARRNGTGKELIATQIHEQSSRHGRVMVRINCAAIPSTLIESELFGREKGAFTGALARQIGRFELADHSTIFLDEIGDLPFDVQVKLLRVLEERQIERLGSPKAVGVNVRIIAATHRNLEQRIADDAFRQDLYYRLNVFPIEVPPLRERTEDIPLLVWRFVDEFSKSFGKRIDAISRENMDGAAALSVAGKHPRAAQRRRARDDRCRRAQPDDRRYRRTRRRRSGAASSSWTSRRSTSSASSRDAAGASAASTAPRNGSDFGPRRSRRVWPSSGSSVPAQA